MVPFKATCWSSVRCWSSASTFSYNLSNYNQRGCNPGCPLSPSSCANNRPSCSHYVHGSCAFPSVIFCMPAPPCLPSMWNVRRQAQLCCSSERWQWLCERLMDVCTTRRVMVSIWERFDAGVLRETFPLSSFLFSVCLAELCFSYCLNKSCVQRLRDGKIQHRNDSLIWFYAENERRKWDHTHVIIYCHML